MVPAPPMAAAVELRVLAAMFLQDVLDLIDGLLCF